MDSLTRTFVILLSLLVFIGAGIAVYIYVLPKSSSQSGSATSTRTFSPEEISQNSKTEGKEEESFERCFLTKEKHPLLSYLGVQANSLNGVIDGTIISLAGQEEVIDFAYIELQSSQGQETHKFIVPKKQGLIKDIEKQDLAVKDLKAGDRLLVSFRCNPASQGDFQINQIVVIVKK